jgi:hypothetical protein
MTTVYVWSPTGMRPDGPNDLTTPGFVPYDDFHAQTREKRELKTERDNYKYAFEQIVPERDRALSMLGTVQDRIAREMARTEEVLGLLYDVRTHPDDEDEHFWAPWRERVDKLLAGRNAT